MSISYKGSMEVCLIFISRPSPSGLWSFWWSQVTTNGFALAHTVYLIMGLESGSFLQEKTFPPLWKCCVLLIFSPSLLIVNLQSLVKWRDLSPRKEIWDQSNSPTWGKHQRVGSNSDEFRTRTYTFQSSVREDDCPVVVDETEGCFSFLLKSEFRAWQNGSIYLLLTTSIKNEETEAFYFDEIKIYGTFTWWNTMQQR